MSPISFAMLSGAGLVKGRKKADGVAENPIYVHTTYDMVVETVGGKKACKLSNVDRNGATVIVSKEAPIYPVVLDSAGAQAKYLSAITEAQVKVCDEDGKNVATATIGDHGEIKAGTKTIVFELAADQPGDSRQDTDTDVVIGDTVRIDCYEVHYEEATEMSIEAQNFAGYYYIEASTLFRDEATGVDLPAEFVIPRGKIQTNFTFTMNNSGDPSSFSFVIDCFPAYTKFNKKKKVMALLQVVDKTDTTHNYTDKTVMGHKDRTKDSDVDSWYSKSVFTEVAGE